MTHPIPGADSERALFEAKTLEQFAAATFDKLPPGRYRVGWVQDQWIGWQTGRAAAKVGANVAADIDSEAFRRLAELWSASSIVDQPGWNPERTLKLWNSMIAHIKAWSNLRAAGAPAETPKPTGHKPPVPEADRIGPLGERLFLVGTLCNYGTACAIAAQPAPAPIAGDVENDALIKALTDIKEMTDCDNSESYRRDDREGCLDAVFSTASGALAAMLANSSSGEAG